jgi:cytochrome c6
MNSENLKRILVIVAVSCLAPSITMAADIENGERIFSANCSACHAGGNNVIIPEKTLKKDVLEANGMNSVNAITYQVTNGKNAMPAFGGRLDDSDIEDVANYVLSQSEKGWD